MRRLRVLPVHVKRRLSLMGALEVWSDKCGAAVISYILD